MKPDYEEFLPLIESMDLSYEGKAALLDALWTVVTGIVELAFTETDIPQPKQLPDDKSGVSSDVEV